MAPLKRIPVCANQQRLYLIEIFLPVADNEGKLFSHGEHQVVERELTEAFGGVTAYPRAPARGSWKDSEAVTQKDDLIVYEVMSEELDLEWWSQYRNRLEQTFRQEQLVVRAQKIVLL
jgi:hypothetical protein